MTDLVARLRDDLTRTELRRIAEEFMSERDAAKRDALRAFDERDLALNEIERLRTTLREIASGSYTGASYIARRALEGEP